MEVVGFQSIGTKRSQDHIAALMGTPFESDKPRNCVMVKAFSSDSDSEFDVKPVCVDVGGRWLVTYWGTWDPFYSLSYFTWDYGVLAKMNLRGEDWRRLCGTSCLSDCDPSCWGVTAGFVRLSGLRPALKATVFGLGPCYC